MNESHRGKSAALLLFLCLSAVAATALVAQQAQRESLDHFPQGAVEISAAGGPQHFRVWLADTPARSEQGLMYVRSLEHDRGMLFPRNNPGPMAMWMKNTLIPLDMLFLNADGTILYIRRNATPQSEAIIKVPAPIATPVAAVLELAGGECDRRGIAQGDTVHSVSSD